MKTVIGIDTGGTYTDAVVYDCDKSAVLCSAKALTTKEDLSVGICNALDGLDSAYFPSVKTVSLSTTLATNACVEDKGGRAKLLMIGIDRKTVEWVGGKYGLSEKSGDLYFCPNRGSFDGKVIDEPGWDALRKDTAEWLSDADGIGVVEIYAMNNGAVVEKKAKEELKKHYNVPVVCGHELFSDLNSLQRAASTLLNAKLIPIIDDFTENIKKAILSRGITAPTVIVRSDCTQMSEEFSKHRPVETVLCGPAASVLGGMTLTDEKNCVIIDMGGTTTDISIVSDGVPLKVRDGISIGKWKTYVNGVFIETFGLGGDSAIRLNKNELEVTDKRVMPLCVASARWSSINDELKALAESERFHSIPLHEFFCLVRDIADSPNYTNEEKRFCAALEKRPLMFEAAAKACGKDIYYFKTERLEREGVVQRIGLTPTDIMHIKGDFNKYDSTASLYALNFIMRSLGHDYYAAGEKERFCDTVYNMIKKKLYCNITRILLQNKHPELYEKGLSPQLENIIAAQWDEFSSGKKSGMISHVFSTEATLVSIGAPTHIFLPDVARALGARCVIPENAGVANAVGAAVCNVGVTVSVEIRPMSDVSGIEGYRVYGKDGVTIEKELEAAIASASEEAAQKAADEAKKRGYDGEPKVRLQVSSDNALSANNNDIYLGTTVTATII